MTDDLGRRRLAALKRMMEAIDADKAKGIDNPGIAQVRLVTEQIDDLRSIVAHASPGEKAAAEAHFGPTIRDLEATRAQLRRAWGLEDDK